MIITNIIWLWPKFLRWVIKLTLFFILKYENLICFLILFFRKSDGKNQIRIFFEQTLIIAVTSLTTPISLVDFKLFFADVCICGKEVENIHMNCINNKWSLMFFIVVLDSMIFALKLKQYNKQILTMPNINARLCKYLKSKVLFFCYRA
jgi:hypothetical protein